MNYYSLGTIRLRVDFEDFIIIRILGPYSWYIALQEFLKNSWRVIKSSFLSFRDRSILT